LSVLALTHSFVKQSDISTVDPFYALPHTGYISGVEGIVSVMLQTRKLSVSRFVYCIWLLVGLCQVTANAVTLA